MTSIKRRQFIQSSLLATAGAMILNPRDLFATPTSILAKDSVPDRSLSPFVLLDDLVRLIELSDLDESIRTAIRENVDFFQASRFWRLPDEELVKLFKRVKTAWKSENSGTQLTFCGGSVVHRTLDKWLKPDSGAELNDLPERVLYQDTYVMKMLQNADPNRKKLSIKESLKGVAPEQMAEVFHLIQQRNLIRTHTIKPELEETESWLGDFLAYYHQLDTDNERYAQVYCNPDPTKVDQYILKPNFYDENDAIIKTTRSVQMGLAEGLTKVDSLVKTEPNSIYGKALHEALKRMLSVGQYVVSEISEEQLKNAVSV